MTRAIMVAALCAAALLIGAAQRDSSGSQSDEDGVSAITGTLDALHAAAAKGDGAAYFKLFAPDAVFLGTDATERWTLAEFKAYAQQRFDQGTGWTYTLVPGSRHITIADGSTIAWFDELLDNAKYGRCRGTGVLRRIDNEWKIAQYNLTFTIPNEVASAVVALVKAKHEQPAHR